MELLAKDDKAHRRLPEAYNEATLSNTSCYKWFQTFQNGKLVIDNKEGRKCTNRRNIRGYSTNNFTLFKIVWNDLKTMKLRFIRNEVADVKCCLSGINKICFVNQIIIDAN